MAQNVEADQVDGAEGRGLRPADGLSRQGVDVFDGEIHLLHQPHHVEHGKRADAVADEIGSVFGEHDAFAQVHVAEVRDNINRGAVRFRRRDNLQQAHVARRIEEVSAEPCPAEVVGESFRDFAHWQAAGVRCDDGPGFANRFDVPQQGPLDVEILDHGFDDPVGFCELRQVVLEITDSYKAGQR